MNNQLFFKNISKLNGQLLYKNISKPNGQVLLGYIKIHWNKPLTTERTPGHCFPPVVTGHKETEPAVPWGIPLPPVCSGPAVEKRGAPGAGSSGTRT